MSPDGEESCKGRVDFSHRPKPIPPKPAITLFESSSIMKSKDTSLLTRTHGCHETQIPLSTSNVTPQRLRQQILRRCWHRLRICCWHHRQFLPFGRCGSPSTLSKLRASILDHGRTLVTQLLGSSFKATTSLCLTVLRAEVLPIYCLDRELTH